MRTLFHSACRTVFACILLGAAVFCLRARDSLNSSDDVVNHLNHAISWYHRTVQLCQSVPVQGAATSRDELRGEALYVLQNAFDYAQAEAALIAPSAKVNESAANSSGKSLQDAYNSATQRVNAARAQITAIEEQIAKAGGKKRTELISQRDVLNAELQVNLNLQSTLKKLLDYMSTAGEGGSSTGLPGKINDLLQTVPEARPGKQTKPATPMPAVNAANTFHPDSAGVLSLGIEIFTLMRGRVQLDQQVSASRALLQQVQGLRAPIRARIRGLLAQIQQLSTSSQAVDSQTNAQLRDQLKQLERDFSGTSETIVPLAKEAFQIEAARSNLQEWSGQLQREYMTALRYLLLRFGEIAIVIVFILFLSEIWRRLTFRYVRDQRLRRQMLLIRRIVMGFAISLTVVLSFVTEFGSFATFAGFITAGIAVALQNLILSVVAYFFLIGRYGARVGDRITISGVTGEVIEVGLVRLYMMELTGTGNSLRPTGRIVIFSNSVLFQPAALFKQLPGTDYSWHSVTTTLAPDADLKAAETRLMAAANSVFSKYKSTIARQHAAFERAVNIQLSEPAPERYIKYTEKGLEFSVRYPVDMGNGAAIDEQMMKALLDTINSEPKINFAAGPKIEPG